MHLWSVFLVQNSQFFRGPAAPRARLQDKQLRNFKALILILADTPDHGFNRKHVLVN